MLGQGQDMQERGDKVLGREHKVLGHGELEGHDELMGQDGLEGHDEQMGQHEDGGWRRDRPKPRPQGWLYSTAP